MGFGLPRCARRPRQAVNLADRRSSTVRDARRGRPYQPATPSDRVSSAGRFERLAALRVRAAPRGGCARRWPAWCLRVRRPSRGRLGVALRAACVVPHQPPSRGQPVVPVVPWPTCCTAALLTYVGIGIARRGAITRGHGGGARPQRGRKLLSSRSGSGRAGHRPLLRGHGRAGSCSRSALPLPLEWGVWCGGTARSRLLRWTLAPRPSSRRRLQGRRAGPGLSGAAGRARLPARRRLAGPARAARSVRPARNPCAIVVGTTGGTT